MSCITAECNKSSNNSAVLPWAIDMPGLAGPSARAEQTEHPLDTDRDTDTDTFVSAFLRRACDCIA